MPTITTVASCSSSWPRADASLPCAARPGLLEPYGCRPPVAAGRVRGRTAPDRAPGHPDRHRGELLRLEPAAVDAPPGVGAVLHRAATAVLHGGRGGRARLPGVRG